MRNHARDARPGLRTARSGSLVSNRCWDGGTVGRHVSSRVGPRRCHRGRVEVARKRPGEVREGQGSERVAEVIGRSVEREVVVVDRPGKRSKQPRCRQGNQRARSRSGKCAR